MTGCCLLESDVLFYGDVAIVPFVCEIEIGGPGLDKPFTNKLRILDVFAKLNGSWVQVATDTAQSPDKQAATLASPRTLGDEAKKKLLDAREAVWRAFFACDRANLEEHLATCGACRLELEQLRGDGAMLALSVLGAKPPQRSRQRLLDAMAKESVPTLWQKARKGGPPSARRSW
jgi:hypothetical protein